jgi:alanine racemase
LEQLTFYRDTWVEINLDCIYSNVKNIRNYLAKEIEIIAVVKANGYGHGALQVAKEALNAGATSLAVSLLDEAISLRYHGILAPILVLGATRAEDIDLAVKHQITLTVFSAEWLKEAAAHKQTSQLAQIHVKFDTGMGRLGIRTKAQWTAIVEQLDRRVFEIEGVFTHFATADELDTSYFDQQYKRFLLMLQWVKEAGIYPKKIHCANSATTLRFIEKSFNAVRVGIIMYGLTPHPAMEHLIPLEKQVAFSLHSRIYHIKKVEQGQGISYGATYKTKKEEWIATIPIGYADGWQRKLQGFFVLVNGKKFPIVGRVCMDQCMVRLDEEVPVGTQVTLIGKQKNNEVTMEEVAEYLDTINYEIICGISTRVPRVYIKNRTIIETVNHLIISSDLKDSF